MRRRVAATWAMLALALFAPAAARAQEGPSGDYYVYVAAESEDQVALVRFGPEGTAVVENVVVGIYPTEIDGPHGISVDPANQRWYVSIAHGNPYGQVHAYSTVDNRKIGQVPVGLFPASMSVTPTNLMFVVNFNLHGEMVPSSVSIVSTGEMLEVARLQTCTMPHGSRLTADGARHYSVCMMDDMLIEIDAREFRVARHFM
ncbi:MAG TPA: YncE family protein, partial [Alphaproteobacteria bacterium]|nr:YncE family protein [Alphaproteobacteria bacterium]